MSSQFPEQKAQQTAKNGILEKSQEKNILLHKKDSQLEQ